MVDLTPPEVEPKSFLYLFIGAIPDVPRVDPDEFILDKKYKDAYLANVRFILNKTSAISVVGELENPNSKIVGDLTLSRTYGKWYLANPFNPKITYQGDEKAICYPQDYFVISEDGSMIVVRPGKKNFFSNLNFSQEQRILESERLSEGGRLVIGENIVFYSGDALSPEEEKTLKEFFPSKLILRVHTPQSLGIKDKYRVSSHIDQFIGGPLELSDGRVLIPIDMDYYESAKEELLKTINPNSEKERELVYLPINSSGFYLFNYPFIRGTFFIGPELAKILQNSDYWNNIRSPIEILPQELPVCQFYKAGMKCKLNFI